jgi:uncharacterized protein involved in exopolysaccharide biosynthesis
MGEYGVNTPASRPNPSADGGQEQAAGGISIFGISLGRVMKVPLKHWKLSLLALVFCTGTAIVWGTFFSDISYESVGKMRRTGDDANLKLPQAPPVEDQIEMLKRPQNFDKLNEEFGLGLFREVWLRSFDIKKANNEGSVIEVKLKWYDRKQCKELINYLMDLHLKAMEEDRRQELKRLLRVTEKAITSYEKQQNEALVAQAKFLQEYGNPEDKHKSIQTALNEADKLYQTAFLEYAKKDKRLKECEAEIKKLKEEIRTGNFKPD